jgi:hypothetical protein
VQSENFVRELTENEMDNQDPISGKDIGNFLFFTMTLMILEPAQLSIQ